ncbi:hypothetical protein DdX_17327 [Ditylenchus destructor]|uniref:Uncharacterized protein n=1 Tax=Ditylenchus destructor TaxID=166010 RepID=A0AAD4QZ93_9BILA|nr:hypothetical protein DdX_17327 [Ditylenchus destructor]
MLALLSTIALFSAISAAILPDRSMPRIKAPKFETQIAPLTPEFVDELVAIMDEPRMDFFEKHEKVDKFVLTRLPDSFLDKHMRGGLAYDLMPEDMRPMVNGIVRDKQKSWLRKAVELKQLSETEEFRKGIEENAKAASLGGDLNMLTLGPICVVHGCFDERLPKKSQDFLMDEMYREMRSSRNFKEKFDKLARTLPEDQQKLVQPFCVVQDCYIPPIYGQV